jgi:hypothetical protein
MAAQVGPCDEADRAGRSAQVEYDRRYGEWRGSRWHASLRWFPPAVLIGFLGAWYLTATTGFRLFGVVFFALVVGAVADVLYRPPGVLREWRRAADGERATGKLLAKVQRDGYLVLHDRRSARGEVDVEHLVVGPGGLFVLDSKNWAAVSEPVRAHGGRFWIGRVEQADLLARVREEAEKVAHEIGDLVDQGVVRGQLTAAPVVVVHGVRVVGAPRVFSGVAVVEAGQLLRYLSRAEPVWGPEQVQHVATVANRVLRVKEP